MKIFTRISAVAVASLVLIGGMSQGARADQPPAKNGVPVSVGDLTVTVVGPWRYQQGLAFSVNACTTKDASVAHRYTVGDFTVTTTDKKQVPAQVLPGVRYSFPAAVDVKPGKCVSGYVMVPSVKTQDVISISTSGRSWKPAVDPSTRTFELGKTVVNSDGMYVQLADLHRGKFGIWIAQMTATAQTPVTFSSSTISFVAGDKGTPIFNYEGDAIGTDPLPAESKLAANQKLTRSISFASDTRPTQIIVDGVVFTVPADDQPVASTAPKPASGAPGLPSTGN